jgi:hypothetical protein
MTYTEMKNLQLEIDHIAANLHVQGHALDDQIPDAYQGIIDGLLAPVQVVEDPPVDPA